MRYSGVPRWSEVTSTRKPNWWSWSSVTRSRPLPSHDVNAAGGIAFAIGITPACRATRQPSSWTTHCAETAMQPYRGVCISMCARQAEHQAALSANSLPKRFKTRKGNSIAASSDGKSLSRHNDPPQRRSARLNDNERITARRRRDDDTSECSLVRSDNVFVKSSNRPLASKADLRSPLTGGPQRDRSYGIRSASTGRA